MIRLIAKAWTSRNAFLPRNPLHLLETRWDTSDLYAYAFEFGDGGFRSASVVNEKKNPQYPDLFDFSFQLSKDTRSRVALRVRSHVQKL